MMARVPRTVRVVLVVLLTIFTIWLALGAQTFLGPLARTLLVMTAVAATATLWATATNRRFGLTFVSVTGLVTAIAGLYIRFAGAPPTPVHIDQPPDGQTVFSSSVEVSGTAPRRIRSGHQLWVITDALGPGRWWPNTQLAPAANGSWLIQLPIGPKDQTKIKQEMRFRIMVVDCSADAVASIKKAWSNETEYNLHGMERMRNGVNVLDSVTVYRRPGTGRASQESLDVSSRDSQAK